MSRAILTLSAALLLAAGLLPAQEPAGHKLLIAFGSYRERPRHPNLFLYEHDGVAGGKLLGSVNTPRGVASAEGHPALSQDGRFCAFTFELENNTGKVYGWDLKEQKPIDLGGKIDSPNAQMGPSLSADGRLIAFAAWNRPGGPGQGWHIFLYDRQAKELIDLPGLNDSSADDRMPALSGDGRTLAFVSNRRGGLGLTDIWLYDRSTGQLTHPAGLNSKHLDAAPTLSGDGNLLAFESDRPGGSGGRDIYLFDRRAGGFIPLPGLNTPGHEMSPSLSADGRYLVFVAERLGGEGERDVYLYDRQGGRLLPTPGLNSAAEDFDPCIIVLAPEAGK